MNRFVLASYLLSYPTQELIDDLEDVSPLTSWLKQRDLFAVQEHYVETFDRSPSCSLYIFEHIHGDSKERGKALADLRQMYEEEGYAINTAELPDYLPLFLEFLSQIPEEKALALLKEISHILYPISLHLEKRASPYHEVIVSLVDEKPTQDIGDRSEADIDKLWEEAPVSFHTKGCGQ